NGRGVLFLQNSLLELRLQRCQFSIDLLQLFLVGIGKLRAGADEVFVITLEQIGGLRIEPELIAIVVELLNTREEFPVEMDRVPMRGELWRRFFLDFLHLWIGVARI